MAGPPFRRGGFLELSPSAAGYLRLADSARMDASQVPRTSLTRAPPVRPQLKPPSWGATSIGGVAGSALVLALLALSPMASAASPVYSYRSPFTGATIDLYNYSGMDYCHGFSAVPSPLSFNQSNGHFSVEMKAAAHPLGKPSRSCRGHGSYATDFAGFNLYTPNFTAAKTGQYTLRANWSFHFLVNLTTHIANPATGDGATADFSLETYVYLVEVRPFSSYTYATFGNGTTLSSRSNSTMTFNSKETASFPVVVALTKGAVYSVIFSITAEVDAYTGDVAGDYAASLLDVGTFGPPTIFEGISIS